MSLRKAEHPKLDRLQRRALIAGAAGTIILVVGAFASGRTQFFQSYLFAFLFWNGLSLGCLSALMLHHLVAGRWGYMIQRILEAAARLLPLMLALFLPVFVWGLYDLYPWASDVGADELVRLKEAYLNVPFFRVRALVYFGLWIGLALLLSSFSRVQDKTGDPRLTLRMRWVSGPGLALYVLSMSFAAVDWGMSLEPEWFSTIYGLLFIVGQGLACLAFATVILSMIADDKPHADVMSRDYFHHLGSLMCGFVVLWSYIAFSQFLIIWSGNLPEEIPWYLHRTNAGLQTVAVMLIAFHFAIPLFVLLQRRVKRSVRLLVGMAVWIFLMRIVDLYWIVTPAFHPNRLGLHVLDVAAMVGMGGVWTAAFAWQLRKHPLLPLHDQQMQATLGLEAHVSRAEAAEHA